MKKSIFILAIIFFLGTIFTFAQPSIQWQKTIGGNNYDYKPKIQLTKDGGYIIAENSSSSISGDKVENNLSTDIWIIKLDSIGNIIWQNTIGGNEGDNTTNIHQTFEGGYIVSGNSISGIGGDKTDSCYGNFDYWILKLDELGNLEWQKTFGGNELDESNSIQQTADSGFIIAGYSFSGISGDKLEPSLGLSDYWILKLNKFGDITWQNTIGGGDYDNANSIKQTFDGGFIVAGESYSEISGDKSEPKQAADFWVLKLDNLGNIIWQNTIGGISSDIPIEIQQTPDSGYIIAGISSSNISGDKSEANIGNWDCWIVKLDVQGNILWQNTIGGFAVDAIQDFEQTIDGGFILAAFSQSGIGGDKTEPCFGVSDFWIIKLDAIGNVVWENTIGGNGYDVAYSIKQKADGSYVVVGDSDSPNSGDKTDNCKGFHDLWVLKIQPDVLTLNEKNSILSYNIFPNPTNGIIHIQSITKYKLRITDLQILNLQGQVLLQESNNNEVDISSLSNGVYFLQLTNERMEKLVYKVIKE
ncbi:MAG: T9SS type A sorting domain-containing protein [Chitinophagaceae bacterium]|nr:T9SS type A sorting domain-containing protein [Chitinophagaceae bacterium]